MKSALDIDTPRPDHLKICRDGKLIPARTDFKTKGARITRLRRDLRIDRARAVENADGSLSSRPGEPVPQSPKTESPAAAEPTFAGATSWALFQFAGAPYFVMVNIFVFAAYFQSKIVGDYAAGTVVWGRAQALAGVMVALLSPVLGALADAAGPRKPGLLIFSLVSSFSMAMLWFGVPGTVIQTSIFIVLCAVMMEFAFVYHNAMLTSVSTDKNVGWLSGAAFSLDYVGSISLFLIWLALPMLGVLPENDATNVHERLVGPMAALWFLLFMVPLFLFTPDRPKSDLSLTAAVRTGLRQLGQTLRRVGHYRNIATYFVVRAIYADGMSGVFVFLAGFLGFTFGWDFAKIGLYALLVLSVPAFTSAIAGVADDLFGSKRTIQVSLFFFTLGVLGSLSVTPSEYLFVYPVDAALSATQLPVIGGFLALFGFTTFPEQVSLAFSMFGAAFVGPVLASSRTMVARLSPPEMISELYGLFNLTGKATAFLVAFLVAEVTRMTGSPRWAFAVVIVFLSAGLVGMFWVREERSSKADH
jgi:UMF1 family MFS transporter